MSSNQDMLEERIYTIPLKRAWIAPIKKRTPRAIRILRQFIQKNMNADRVIISSDLNEKLWNKGIEGPPRKIRLKAIKDRENVVTVELVEGE